jgi:hypothetical protein
MGRNWTAAAGMLLMAIALAVFGAGPRIIFAGSCVVVVVLANNLCYISASALLTRAG